jgi:RNA polymerase sigma factor (sigma-70 family)
LQVGLANPTDGASRRGGDMEAGALNRVLDRLRQTVLAQEGANLPDEQLLERFIDRRDEAAFAALLRRHGPMVLSVCRRVAGNGHDAEDAFQTTFLVLVHKAASLRSRALLGPWLHGVARRTALKARTARSRRRRHESLVEAPASSSPAGEEWQELRSLLDDAIQRLPNHYRVPVILCELEGRSRSEVAREMRLPEGTLSSRLAKARRLLARRLARPALLTGTLLASLACPDVLSASLMRSTIQAAALTAADQAVRGAFVASTALWMEGVLKMLARHKLATATLVLLTVGVFGVGTGLVPGVASGPAVQASSATTAVEDKKEQGDLLRGVLKAVDAGKKTLTIKMQVDPSTKETVDKTYRAADDAKVYINDAIEKTLVLPQGTLADLSEGTHIELRLSVDGKSFVSVQARGPGLHGGVKEFDKEKNTLTINTKGKDDLEEQTLKLAKGMKIILDDGIGKKGDPAREGTTENLTEGARIHVQLSVDRKTALGVQIEGATFTGTIKGYDSGTRTLTVEVKEDGQLVEKALTLVKEARIEGDLTPGETVAVRLGVTDKDKVVGVHVLKKDKK